jgi:hypothetical protein
VGKNHRPDVSPTSSRVGHGRITIGKGADSDKLLNGRDSVSVSQFEDGRRQHTHTPFTRTHTDTDSHRHTHAPELRWPAALGKNFEDAVDSEDALDGQVDFGEY